ncbi:MAG TPA: IS5 family transposase [Bryobacteraceae bacterium]|nr:IS5 family transposase [Bryobacteraceae bacterium]
MRGDDQQQTGMFSYVSLEERVPQDHPLRAIRRLVDDILKAMARDFDGMYAKTGRPSVPPERLLRAVLLQIFYSVRSERMLMEQMMYNLLFRWFVGLELDEPVWNHAVFSKNRERLLNHEVAREFFSRVPAQAKTHLSDEHFSGDGTLIEAWASQKSFQKKDGGDSDPGQFHGERRSNETHESKTDPDARLYRKGHGQEARLGYLGHVLMENRNGLIVDAMVTQADGTAERDAALLMLHSKWRNRRRRGRRGPMSVGADKAYDTREFVATLREMNIRAHVAQNSRRSGGSAIDRRTSRHNSYAVSQSKRPLIEKAFGWMKQTGGMRKTKFRGLAKVAWQFVITAAAFNLWRLPKLQSAEV